MSKHIPFVFLPACVHVNFETGILTWRERPREHFASEWAWKVWNKVYPGTQAGSPNGNGYLVIHLTFNGKTRKLYVQIIVWALAYGAWPPRKIDHKNGVRDDNRLNNLRLATNNENAHNMGKVEANTTGYPGVVRHGNGVIAQISFEHCNYYLGHYPEPEDGYRIYLAAKAILHPFAPTPRDAPAPDLRSFDRMRAAHRIVKAARRRGDVRLEIDAWDHFVAAM